MATTVVDATGATSTVEDKAEEKVKDEMDLPPTRSWSPILVILAAIIAVLGLVVFLTGLRGSSFFTLALVAAFEHLLGGLVIRRGVSTLNEAYRHEKLFSLSILTMFSTAVQLIN